MLRTGTAEHSPAPPQCARQNQMKIFTTYVCTAVVFAVAVAVAVFVVVVVVVVLLLSHRQNNQVRGHRTGSNNSGVEEYLGKK